MCKNQIVSYKIRAFGATLCFEKPLTGVREGIELDPVLIFLKDGTAIEGQYRSGFSRKDIQSDKSFKEILENKKWFSKNVDLDYLYQTRIKVLFEAIIDFSTKAQVYINDETKNHKIFTFKMAAKNLAETTKNLKIIQANIKKYSSSSNEFLALEYNKIRSNLGELLRSIEELRVVEDREKLYLIIKNLQKGKEILKEIDTLTLSNVEHLISVRKITTAEGISILNDTTFAAKIAEELIGAVEVIFSKDISN